MLGSTQISGKQKGLRTISLQFYTGEKKLCNFPSCRTSVHTLMRRTTYNFLALSYVYSPKVYKVNLDMDGFLPSNINKSEQFYFNTKLISLGICEQVWGSELTPNNGSNAHVSLLITTLHHKTLMLPHNSLQSVLLYENRTWHLFLPTSDLFFSIN